MEDRKIDDPAQDNFAVPRVVPVLHALAAVGLALWFATVVLWPWLSAGVLSDSVTNSVESFLGTIFCHRISERSMGWHGGQLLVCSRCTGVIAGYLLGAILALCGAERLPFWRIPWALVLIGVMGLSWLGGMLGFLQAQWHFERVIAGACGGLGGYILIACCIILLINWMQRRAHRKFNEVTSTT